MAALTLFGVLPDGTEVHRLTLAAGDLEASILTLGAILQDVRLARVPYGLTLGAPDLAPYLGPMRYFGPVVGPVANRIGGASAEFADERHEFEANFGPHTLHSGSAGTAGKVWQVEQACETSVTLALDLPDGEGGFPGNRRFRAVWTVSAPAVLDLVVEVETDAPTLIMVAHHPYWNLDGSDTWDGHSLRIDAERYLPADDVALPTGEILGVERTRYDFRALAHVPPDSGYDNSYVLSTERRPLRAVATLAGASGVTLEIETTEPALHLYDGSGADASDDEGHDHRRHGPRAGLALEPQFWPDATNHPGFPSIELNPGEPWRQQTRYTFRRS